MYAKLKFPSGTTNGEVVRDITRIIHESSSGSASLSNLEFITTSESELTAGVNSGWALHSSNSLQSGNIDSTNDAQYILQGTSATNNITKYCALYTSGAHSSTSYYNSTSMGFCLGVVFDPNTSTENLSWGYSGTNSSYSGSHSMLTSNRTIRVFADPKRIIILGYIDSGNGAFMVLEGPQGPLDQKQSVCPNAFVFASDATKHNANETAPTYRSSANTGYYYNSSPGDFAQLCNFGTHLAGNEGSTMRLWTASTTGNAADAEGFASSIAKLENSTTTGSDVSEINTDMQWNMAYAASSISTSASFKNSNQLSYTANGTKALMVFPLYIKGPGFFPDVKDFSTLNNVWFAPSGIGTAFEEVTISGNNYVYAPVVDLRPDLGHYLIKIT